jgi:hypothetical protein
MGHSYFHGLIQELSRQGFNWRIVGRRKHQALTILAA